MEKLEINESIQDIYKKLLNVQELDTGLSFLQLGGQSIMAAKLQLECVKAFKIRLTFKEIYDNSSADEMSKLICDRLN
ncbi:acyl carrier protein [Lachnospiraceae bacterium ZAX-1]